MSELGSRTNRNSTQDIEPSHQNLKHQEDGGNRFNHETGQVSKNDLKQNKSHSVWWKSGCIGEHQ